MEREKKSGMFLQAGILAAAGLVVRIIGLLYRSPLTGIIGDEGNGYYTYAYNCYAIILLISAYSIPSAIAKLIAGRLALGEAANAQRIFRGALVYVLVVSGLFSVFTFFGAEVLTYGHSVTVLRVFAPTILFFGFLGVLRGYFQAQRTMVPTSISQILEQLVNAAVSVGAAWSFVHSAGALAEPTERAVRGAVGSALGTGAGVLAAFFFMLYAYGRDAEARRGRLELDGKGATLTRRGVAKLLFFTVTPFILSTFIYNFSTMLDQTIFQRILIHARGAREEEAAVAYGIFASKAVLIANIPIALSNALSSAIIPNLAATRARGDDEETAELVGRAIRVTLMVSVPCAMGLISLARPIMLLLFPQRVSLEEASGLLAGVAVTVVFYSLSTVTNAVLQGIGRMDRPVANAAVALVLQGAALAALLLYTRMDNEALVIAVILYSGLMCVFNHRSVKRELRYETDLRHSLLVPLVSSALMAVVARLVYLGLSLVLRQVLPGEYLVNLLSLLPAILTAIWVYAIVLIRLGGVSEEMLRTMPRGRVIARLLLRLRVLKH